MYWTATGLLLLLLLLPPLSCWLADGEASPTGEMVE
jgi:hypothetical protein